MRLRNIIYILSHNDLKASVWIIMGVIVRALLDFAGVAALLSVILLLLGHEKYQPYIWIAASGGVGFIFLKNILSVWLERRQSVFLLSLYRNLSTRLLCSYYHNGLLFVRETGASVLTHEVNYVCYSFALQVLAPLLKMMGEAIVLLLLITALILYSPQVMLFLALYFIPAFILYILLMYKRLDKYGKAENSAKKSQWRVVQELFNGYAEVETNQAYSIFRDRFEKGLNDICCSREQIETYQRLPSAIIEIGVSVILLILVLIGGSGEHLKITLGIFGIATFRILPSIRTLLSGWTQIRNNNYTTSILVTSLSEEENNSSLSQEVLTFNEELKVEHISFSYNKSEDLVIDDFSLAIKQGERVGIQGISGIGKSTLFNLLLGFISPDKGQITLDGVLLKTTNRSSFHRIVGYVPQDVFIIAGSITENIALGQNSNTVDKNRILSILKEVKLAEWVMQLSDGLNTPLGENGYRLSGGQKQRIGIARALYKEAKILFFDEATSSLDSQTEEEIIDVINKLSESHPELTLLMIAHRKSSLRICDRIVTL